MEKLGLLYSGKAKNLYQTNDPDVLWVEYKDQATALNGVKKDQIVGKGRINNRIMEIIFTHLAKEGHANHFIKRLSDTEQLVKAVEIIPLEVVLRNVAAGSFSKRFGIEEGTALSSPIIEFYYKSDQLDDPFMNEDHIQYLGLASPEEITKIKQETRLVNDSLKKLFAHVGIQLIDFKLEYGRTKDGTILLADEISPDTCRLWDMKNKEHLDKDVYRRDLGDLLPVYEVVYSRLSSL